MIDASDYLSMSGASRLDDCYFSLVEDLFNLPALTEDRLLGEAEGVYLQPEATPLDGELNHELIMSEVAQHRFWSAMTCGELPVYLITSQQAMLLDHNHLEALPNTSRSPTLSSGRFTSGKKPPPPIEGKALFVTHADFRRFATPILLLRGYDPQKHGTGPLRIFQDLHSGSKAVIEKERVDFTRRGGSKPKEFWEGAINHVWEMIYLGKFMPKQQAEIERTIKDWVVANGYDEPSPSAVRGRAKAIFHSYLKD